MGAGFWKRHIILVIPDCVFTLGYRYLGVTMFEVFLGVGILSFLSWYSLLWFLLPNCGRCGVPEYQPNSMVAMESLVGSGSGSQPTVVGVASLV